MNATTVRCEDVIRQVWDWLDREQDRAQWEAIERHLADCTGCASHVAFARSFLHHAKDAPLPDDLTALRVRVGTALTKARSG
ncbi:MAG: anti-sigma factor [Gemmatimonadetes bacterium]|nr:anti-sigma factor [Gemmatimonadota bacterium]